MIDKKRDNPKYLRDDRASNKDAKVKQELTIHDLGWTPEQAAQLRAQFAVFAEDWDDASMDVYDEL